MKTGKLVHLEVSTVPDNYIFTGEDAEAVYKAIYSAGARGAVWTTPISLQSGQKITFVLPNIISFTETFESKKA